MIPKLKQYYGKKLKSANTEQQVINSKSGKLIDDRNCQNQK